MPDLEEGFHGFTSLGFPFLMRFFLFIQPGYLQPLLPDTAPTEPEVVKDVFAGKASRWPSKSVTFFSWDEHNCLAGMISSASFMQMYGTKSCLV